MDWPTFPFQHGPGAQVVTVRDRVTAPGGGGVDVPAAPGAGTSVTMTLQARAEDLEHDEEARRKVLRLDGFTADTVTLRVGQVVTLAWGGATRKAEIREAELIAGVHQLLLEVPL